MLVLIFRCDSLSDLEYYPDTPVSRGLVGVFLEGEGW